MSEECIGFYDSTNYFNLIEQNALDLVDTLKQRGNRVIGYAADNSAFHRSLDTRNIPVCLIGAHRSYANLILSFRLVQSVKRVNCKTLVILRPHDLPIAAMAKLFFYRRLKLVFFQQIKFHLRRNYLLYSLLFRPFDAWIVSMGNYKKQLVRLSSFSPEKVFHISPGVDTEHYKIDTLSKESARKVLKVPGEVNLLGVMGIFHKTHKLDFPIRAIQLLRKNNHNVELLIWGEPKTGEEKEYFSFLKELAAECGIEEYVHFRPDSNKEVTFFKAIDIYTQATPNSLIGSYILKAMASERPVIARHTEEVYEITGKGKFGMYYHNQDLEDFLVKIIHLLSQPKLRNHLIKVASKHVHENYNINLQSEKFESVLNKINNSDNNAYSSESYR